VDQAVECLEQELCNQVFFLRVVEFQRRSKLFFVDALDFLVLLVAQLRFDLLHVAQLLLVNFVLAPEGFDLSAHFLVFIFLSLVLCNELVAGVFKLICLLLHLLDDRFQQTQLRINFFQLHRQDMKKLMDLHPSLFLWRMPLPR